MRILILCTKMPWPPKDGGSIVTLNLLKGLADSGCQLTLLTMNTPKHHYPVEEIPVSLREKLDIRAVDVNTNINWATLLLNYLFSARPYNARRFASGLFCRELQNTLSREEYDIIQLEGPYLIWYIPLIRHLSDALISMRAHNTEHMIWEQAARKERRRIRKHYLKKLAKRIFKLEKDILRQIDILVPITDLDADVFRRMGATIPVFVCPPGLDVDRYPENEIQDDIRLFFIGALDWAPNREGLEWFFDAVWPRIRKNWPEMSLSLAGRNPSHYFSRRDVPANVSLEGELEDSLDFYRRHNVMIVPLLSGSGIRVKILEAMSMGKIVISSSMGASGLNAKAGIHFFIADTAEEYVHIISRLEDQPKLLKSVGDSARKYVMENFDNLGVSGNLLSFYKEQLR